MEIKFIRTLTLFLSVAALSAGLVSCQKDSEETGVQGALGKGAISFGMAFENPSQDLTTKGTFDLKDDEGNVFAVMEEEIIPTPVPEETKAALVDEETFYSSFQVTGYQGNSVYQGIRNLTVTKQEEKYPVGEYIWTLPSTIFWPGSDSLEFFAWAPADDALSAATLTLGQSAKAEFTYTVTDALNQKDLMLAHYSGRGKENQLGASDTAVAGVATMNFSHALSSVQFKAEKDNPGLKGVKVNSIAFKGVGKTAKCTAKFGVTTEYVWDTPTATVDAATDNYTKTFDSPVDLYTDGLAPSDGTTFMVIPQIFGADSEASIVLNITKDCSTFDIVYKLANATNPWSAGKTIVYTIKYNGLDIEIDDKVEDDVKKELEIKNVGGKPAYVRALVTGYWVNAEGDIVSIWDPSDENMGVFSPEIFAASPELKDYWVKGADGFFYYTKILPAGEATITRLFDTYTAYESGKPVGLKASDRLEIDIVSQAVVVDEGKAAITSAWGETAANYVDELTIE